jgi:hypothetical protein
VIKVVKVVNEPHVPEPRFSVRRARHEPVPCCPR